MTLNLKKLRGIPTQYMFDSITVTREVPGTSLDPTTGKLTRTVTEVYQGQAWVAPMGTPQETMRGSEGEARVQFEIGIPLDDDTEDLSIQPMDIITVDDSQNDPSIIGRRLTVHGPVIGTFSIYHRYSAWMDDSNSALRH